MDSEESKEQGHISHNAAGMEFFINFCNALVFPDLLLIFKTPFMSFMNGVFNLKSEETQLMHCQS